MAPNTSSLSAIGGKAAGLYRLQAAGLRVPDFVVIPAEAFAAVLATHPPEDEEGRRAALLAFELPPAEQAALAAVLAGWGFSAAALVMVRSSVADEDGADAAFPGLMESVAQVGTLPDLWAAVARCAASAYGARVGAYRRARGLAGAARPAVIVQRQVDTTASGVLFSTFPEYPQELAIHAVWGFGEGLVAGHLAPDEFYFLKATGQLHRQQVVPKPQQWRPAPPPGTGLAPAPVPAARQAVACLPEALLRELFGVGQRLEAALGGPQDVEFVVDGAGVLWVVQARPITQPIPEVVVYDNANIQESYCGVTTPLTFSFAQRAYATVYRQTMRVLGLPTAEVAAYEPVITQLLGLVRGRIYYHINHWYQGLQLLPSFRQNKADMERMMGLTEPVDFVQDRARPLAEKLRLLPRLLGNLGRLLWGFGRLPRRVPAFHAHFGQVYAAFYRQPPGALSIPELLARRRHLDDALLLRWTTPIVNDFRVMMTNGAAVRQLRRAGFADPEAFLSRWLAADPELASAQPAHAMLAIAQAARQTPAIRALVLAAPVDLSARLAAAFPDFHQLVAAFLDQYGDRTIGELKLETRTMRIDPGLFYAYLRNYLVADVPAPPPAAASPSAQAARELAACLRRRPPVAAWRLRRTLARLRQAIRDRESLRLERTRLFGMYRAVYRALGERLAEAGTLPDAAAVFYLTEAEIEQAATPPGLPDAAALVAARRAQFAAYAQGEAPPGRVVVPSPPVAPPSPADLPTDRLRGTGCYPGVVSGEALVIMEPTDDLAVAGRIVVATRTDPGWAALFPTCRGVLIERGSALSHSVILLRELGIPTIINIPHLTRLIRSGQRLRIDGATGEVVLEEKGGG